MPDLPVPERDKYGFEFQLQSHTWRHRLPHDVADLHSIEWLRNDKTADGDAAGALENINAGQTKAKGK
jgi:hypothetical protein